jgi:opacity protein-like surface antigen
MTTLSKRLALILILAPCLSTGLVFAGGDANFFYGQKSISDDVIESAGVDGQTQYGVAVSLEFNWPVALAIDLMSSSDSQTQEVPANNPLFFSTDVDTTEFDVGVRKYWMEKIRPYVGGGLAWVQLDGQQVESGELGGAPFVDTIVDDDDSDLGFWLNAGFLYQIGEHFNIGVDLRYSDSEATLTPTGGGESRDFDSGGTHYGVLLGYHW